MSAAKAGDAESLRKLLAIGLNPNQRYNQGETLLGFAAASGNLDAVQALIMAGCDKPQLDDALGDAVGHTPCVAAILGAGADPNSATKRQSQSVLAAAAQRGDAKSVEILLRAGANVEGIPTGSEGMQSASSGQRVSSGPRPLELAASRDLATVKLLIGYGADVNLPSASNRRTPLHAAIVAKNEACARYLVEKGAEVQKDASPVLYACVSSPSLLRFLLEHDADPNAAPDVRDRIGRDQTALIASVKASQAESVKALLEYGANPDANPNGKGSARSLAQTNPELKSLFDHPSARHSTAVQTRQ